MVRTNKPIEREREHIALNAPVRTRPLDTCPRLPSWFSPKSGIQYIVCQQCQGVGVPLAGELDHARSLVGSPSIGSRHVSLREAITRELRERIVTQVLLPGQRLLERELSAELEVSRIPLREAIVQLETEGLVRVVPRRGAFVASFSRKDLEDFFAVRQALEPLAARLAAARAQTGDLQRMYAQLEDELAALERGDTDAVQRANAALHGTIAEAADSALVTMAMRPLRTRPRWQDALQRGLDLRQIYLEHQALVEAIAAHDAEVAAAISLQHVIANSDATGAAFERLELQPTHPTSGAH